MSRCRGASMFTVCTRVWKSGVHCLYGYIPETAAGYIFCCEKVVIIGIPWACVSRCPHTCTHSYELQIQPVFLFTSAFVVSDSFPVSSSLSRASRCLTFASLMHWNLIFCFLFFISCHRCILRSPGPSYSAAVSAEPRQSQETPGDANTSTKEEQNLAAHTPTAKAARSDPATVPKWLKLPGEKGCGM